jgi:hypothetical protein
LQEDGGKKWDSRAILDSCQRDVFHLDRLVEEDLGRLLELFRVLGG